VNRLRSAKEKMRLEDAAWEKSQYATAQATLADVLNKARSGDFSGVAGLDTTMETLTSKSTDYYSTFADYARDYYKTYNSISDLEKLTGKQLTKEETMVSLLKNQIDTAKLIHDSELTAMDSQLNALLGINAGVLSVAQAIGNLKTAQATVAATTQDFGKNAELNKVLASITGYTGNFGGGQYGAWLQTQLPNVSADFGVNADLNRALAAQTGYAGDFGGGQFQAWLAAGSPQFAGGGDFGGGWRMVGERGPELEFTGPSTIVSNAESKKLLNIDELRDELRALRIDQAKQSNDLKKISERATRILERWEAIGPQVTRTT
jgi:hypothetical protein